MTGPLVSSGSVGSSIVVLCEPSSRIRTANGYNAFNQGLFGNGEAGIEQAVEISLRFFAGAVSAGFRARLLSIRGRQVDTAFSAILRE